jgi:HPt (histidine-containing phosphotransfer) domain-containing protein
MEYQGVLPPEVPKVTLQINKEELLSNSFMDDEDLFLESIDLFLERAGGRYDNLDGAVKARDEQKVMEEAHAIKGMVGIFTTAETFEAAKKLEFMGRNKDLAGVDEALADFKDKLDQLCALMKQWKEDL